MSQRTSRHSSNHNSNASRGHRRNRHQPYILTEEEQPGVRSNDTSSYGPSSIALSNVGTIATPDTAIDTPSDTRHSARARRRGITDFSGYDPSMATRPLPPVPNLRRENAFNDKYNNKDDNDDDGSSCPGSDDDFAPSYISRTGQSSNAATEPDSGWTDAQIRIEQQVRSRLRDRVQQERARNAAQATRLVHHNNTDSSCPGSEDESPIIPSSPYSYSSANTRAGQQMVRGRQRPRPAEDSRAQAEAEARAELSDGDESVYTEFEY